MDPVPSTFPVHEGDPPASIEDLAHTELADSDVDIPYNLLRDVSPTPTVERRFLCHRCDRHFSQLQTLSRHRRAAHKKLHPCVIPGCKYKWYRPCDYRAHIEKRHPKASSDKILGKPAGDRSKSKIIGRDTLLHPPPSVIESERRSQAKVTHVSPPTMSPVACDPQLEYTEPAITTCRHENTFGLDCLGLGINTDDPPVSSEEEYGEIMNALDAIIEGDQDRTVELPFTCSHPFCIADYEVTDQET